MLILDILRASIRSLLGKRSRTMLTMLGIVVGVGSVIVMLAYGEGQKRELLARFEGWSERLMSIEFAYFSWRDNLTVPRSVQLSEDDIDAILAECSAVSDAVAVAHSNAQVRYGTTTEERQMLVAAAPSYFDIHGSTLQSGNYYTEDDEQSMSWVCVLGATAWENFFDSGEAIGEYIVIGGRRYRVVGVLRSMGMRWMDRFIYIPWSTGMKRTTLFYQIDGIEAQAVSTDLVDRAKRQVRELLHLRYPTIPVPEDMNDDDVSPIFIRSVQSFLSEREQAADSFSLLLKVIGALSLLIGGVGVMNIMLVSVHERTPEIGLRKAIGARRRDIIGQFLAESVMICLAGGAVGMVLATTVCRYLERMPDEANVPDPVITTWAIIIAVVVTIGTGLFFGVYPAVQAARLNPIDALHEG